MRRVAILLVPLAVLAVTSGCGSSYASLPANRHYSVTQVKHAFADQGVQLGARPYYHSGVTTKSVMFLYANKPGPFQGYVYVQTAPCKCPFTEPLAFRKTRHGNVTVFWPPTAKSTVRAALNELN